MQLSGAVVLSRDTGLGSGFTGEALGFDGGPHEWGVAGEEHRAGYGYDPAPAEPGLQGAGTVHHIAWASRDEDHESWQARASDAGARVTPVIDRDYLVTIRNMSVT